MLEQKTNSLTAQIDTFQQQIGTLIRQTQADEQVLREASRAQVNQITGLQGQNTNPQNQLAAAQQQISQLQAQTNLPPSYQGDMASLGRVLQLVTEQVYGDEQPPTDNIQLTEIERRFRATQ